MGKVKFFMLFEGYYCRKNKENYTKRHRKLKAGYRAHTVFYADMKNILIDKIVRIRVQRKYI